MILAIIVALAFLPTLYLLMCGSFIVMLKLAEWEEKYLANGKQETECDD